MKHFLILRGVTTTLLFTAALVSAETSITSLDPVVVTSVRPKEPLTIITDTKAPAQPVPAHDGADVLRNIPGFAVIRKGGADGDPMLRGMAGSRLNILVEGEAALGGCSSRMDPPTAYIFPAAYDSINVIKGPQSVRYGPMSPAGLVRFERAFTRRNAPGASGFASVTIGDFGRFDHALDLRGGTASAQGRLAATYATMNDYVDGAGRAVHAHYERWSTNASLAWTPDDQTFIELSGARSGGEAAYADRMMDGVVFDRANSGLRLRRAELSTLVAAIELQAYRNYVDHVMDNYSLRAFTPTMMMPGRAASNPDRLTVGGRLTVDLTPSEGLRIDLGLDHQANRHRIRSTMNQSAMPYQNILRATDARLQQTGVFAEVTYTAPPNTRLYSGVRIDRWSAHDHRATLRLGAMGSTAANPTAGLKRATSLPGAFARLEHDVNAGSTFYLGLGHTQRFPDYWELFSPESTTSLSGFNTAVEKTTQIDTGWLVRHDRLDFSIATFAARLADYILIQNRYLKVSGPMGATRTATVARNIDATTLGGEISLGYRCSQALRLDTSLVHVRGENTTDQRPLAQLPPLEARIGLTYTQPTWSTGLLWRSTRQQNHVAVGQGNIVGQDLGPTKGFDVVSLNASWQPVAGWRISGGVDNLFAATYAEHVSRGGAAVAGYLQTIRVNEPGRFLWLKCDYRF